MNVGGTRIYPIIKRGISTSAALHGRRNFRKFQFINNRGTQDYLKKLRNGQAHPLIPFDKRGVRDIEYTVENGKQIPIPETIPELIVPDLTDFKLKPYVSYRAQKPTQEEFTAEDLFNAVYAPKIIDDWNKKQLNEDGTSKNPSENELLQPEDAFIRARKTGSDIF